MAAYGFAVDGAPSSGPESNGDVVFSPTANSKPDRSRTPAILCEAFCVEFPYGTACSPLPPSKVTTKMFRHLLRPDSHRLR